MAWGAARRRFPRGDRACRACCWTASSPRGPSNGQIVLACQRLEVNAERELGLHRAWRKVILPRILLAAGLLQFDLVHARDARQVLQLQQELVEAIELAFHHHFEWQLTV